MPTIEEYAQAAVRRDEQRRANENRLPAGVNRELAKRIEQLGYAGDEAAKAASTAVHLHQVGYTDEMVFEALAAQYPPTKKG